VLKNQTNRNLRHISLDLTRTQQNATHNKKTDETLPTTSYHQLRSNRLGDIKTNTSTDTQSTPLTNFPFFSRHLLTMTVLSKQTASSSNQVPTHKHSPALIALAKSISAKVIKPSYNCNNEPSPSNFTEVNLSHNNQTKTYNIPKIIPPLPACQLQPPATINRIPITIHIHAPAKKIGIFDKPRILLSLLHAFQSIDNGAKILPTISTHPNNETNNNKIIFHANDIPTNNINIDRYFEYSPTKRNDHFHARILLQTNIELHQYKKRATFCSMVETGEHPNRPQHPPKYSPTRPNRLLYSHVTSHRPNKKL
jgi:hypothetical protein